MNSLWKTSQSSAVNERNDSRWPTVATRSETPLRAAEPVFVDDACIAVKRENSDAHPFT